MGVLLPPATFTVVVAICAAAFASASVAPSASVCFLALFARWATIDISPPRVPLALLWRVLCLYVRYCLLRWLLFLDVSLRPFLQLVLEFPLRRREESLPREALRQ